MVTIKLTVILCIILSFMHCALFFMKVLEFVVEYHASILKVIGG